MANVGTGQHIWNPSTLSIAGTGAPQGSQIITGQFAYGALGTCQNSRIQTVYLPAVGVRNADWRVYMDGQGAVWAGVVDQAIQQEGELATTELFGKHRVDEEAYGAQVGASNQYGVYAWYVDPYTRKIDYINKLLEPYPTADYGTGPDLVTAIGLPQNASYRTYDLASGYLSLTSRGYAIPDYVTDALFDPGEGWQKYTYSRYPPNYVVRKGQSLSVNPSTVMTEENANVIAQSGLSLNGSSQTFQNEYGQLGIRTSGASPTRRNKKLIVTIPYKLTSIHTDYVMRLICNYNRTNDYDSSKNVYGVATADITVKPFEAHNQKSLILEFPEELVRDAGEIYININVFFVDKTDTYLDQMGTVQLGAYTAKLTYEHPNTAAVTMPEGWAAPYAVGPIYEIKLRGWHIPPFLITGLPSGLSQMAAGSVVTWNKDEVTTTITTAAWPYAGQRRR